MSSNKIIYTNLERQIKEVRGFSEEIALFIHRRDIKALPHVKHCFYRIQHECEVALRYIEKVSK